MDAFLPHQLRYVIEGHVPVSVVGESLVANAYHRGFDDRNLWHQQNY